MRPHVSKTKYKETISVSYQQSLFARQSSVACPGFSQFLPYLLLLLVIHMIFIFWIAYSRVLLHGRYKEITVCNVSWCSHLAPEPAQKGTGNRKYGATPLFSFYHVICSFIHLSAFACPCKHFHARALC